MLKDLFKRVKVSLWTHVNFKWQTSMNIYVRAGLFLYLRTDHPCTKIRRIFFMKCATSKESLLNMQEKQKTRAQYFCIFFFFCSSEMKDNVSQTFVWQMFTHLVELTGSISTNLENSPFRRKGFEIFHNAFKFNRI